MSEDSSSKWSKLGQTTAILSCLEFLSKNYLYRPPINIWNIYTFLYKYYYYPYAGKIKKQILTDVI